MLALDMIQGVLLLLTMFAVGIAGLIVAGGFQGIREMEILG